MRYLLIFLLLCGCIEKEPIKSTEPIKEEKYYPPGYIEACEYMGYDKDFSETVTRVLTDIILKLKKLEQRINGTN